MHYSDKIKSLQEKSGIETDGVASSKTWLHIYHLLFNAVPYDINVDSMIKAIQQKIGVRADGYPWTTTIDVLYDLLVVKTDQAGVVAPQAHLHAKSRKNITLPLHRRLVQLAAAHRLYIRILNQHKKELP